ncbi:MAG TPA: tRNA (adenosine(37)-N6)-threonylcarbamoyltransferase complex dimerization subunit type 1 TsaB [Casimicrobiaceae bacterium]
MKLLAIECSTAWLSVCAHDGRALATRRDRSGAGASARILGFVDEVLADAGWKLGELDGIAFGSGPGAFTGLRIACGTVQGLALGAALPVVGIASLAAMAQAASRIHGATRVVACLDARMREVYFGAYRRRADLSVDDWLTDVEPLVCPPGEVTPPRSGASGWFGAGDGFAADPGLAQRLALAGVDASIIPDAIDVATLAERSFATGDGRPARDAQPLYVRHRVALTEAERAAGVRL